MNLALVFQSGDFVLISVFVILVIMSIVTWSIIILRAIRLRKAKNGNAAVKKLVLASFTLNEAVQKAKSVDSPMGRLTEEAVKAHQNYRQSDAKLLANALPLNEYLVTQIRNSMSQIMRQFEGGMTSLASIGATAPFIGLFGTVWGIQPKRPDEYCRCGRSDWRGFGIDSRRPVRGDSCGVGLQFPQPQYENPVAGHGRLRSRPACTSFESEGLSYGIRFDEFG